MAEFIKKRHPKLFIASSAMAIVLMIGYVFFSYLNVQASVASNFTNNGAGATTVAGSATDVLVLDVTIPDAWNGAGNSGDTLLKSGSTSSWQGDTLNAFTALGSITGVGYKEDGTGGFQGTEPVVRDLDADSVYTGAADSIVIDNADTPSAGDIIYDVTSADILCSDNTDLASATCVYTDTDGTPCDATTGGETYYLGAACTAGTDTQIVTGHNWATTDDTIDATTDFIKENVAEELTYSASADTDVYTTGGLSAGDSLTDFGANDKFSGSAPIDSTENILSDVGTNANVVDRQDDQLIGIGLQNTGTAVNSTDITSVKIYSDGGAAGFQGSGTDTLLGTMTVNSGDNKEWYLGSLTTAIPNGGLRIFAATDLPASPTNARTMIFQVPTYSDAGSDGVASQDNDEGVFVSSNNDGPTDSAILNAATQTIDSQAPQLTSFDSTTAAGTYSATETINIRANYDENVAGGSTLTVVLDTGDSVTLNSISGTTISGTYTVGAGDNSSDLTISSITSQNVADSVGNTNTTTSIPGGQNLADNEAIVVDTTAPTITSATSTTANGTYGPAQGINITVNFSENVTSAAGLAITLDTGAVVNTGALSNQASFSGTYTVGATGSGETSLDLTISGITGTIQDQATTTPNSTTNPSIPGGQNIADSKAIVVDTTAPVLQSFDSTTATGTYGPTSPINIRANYNENLAGGSTINVILSNGESLTLTSVSGTSISGTYVVGATNSGEDRSDIDVIGINVESVSDSAGNTATGSVNPPSPNNFASNEDINIDTTAPVLQSFDSTTAAGTYGPTSTINVRATYSDNMAATLDGTSTLTVTLSNGVSVVLNSVSGMTVSGTYTVGATGSGEDATDLTVSAITSEAVKDNITNPNTQAGSSVPSSPNNFGDNENINIDTTAPTITSATSTTADGSYGPGSALNITLNFSENVTSAGLSITLNTGNIITTGAISNASTYSGTYTVCTPTSCGENASDLTISSITGTIADQATNPNTTTNPMPPAGQNLGNLKDLRVDTNGPVLISFDSTKAAGTYGPGEQIDIRATYNELLNVASTLTVTLSNGVSVPMSTVVGSSVSGTYTVGATGSGQDITDITVSSITSEAVVDNLTANPNTQSSSAVPGSPNNFADNENINIDTTAPVLQSFTSTTGDGTYGPTSAINVTATYTDNMAATLDPTSSIVVVLDNGETVNMTTVSGMTITGTYTVGATGSGQDSSDLTVASITSQAAIDNITSNPNTQTGTSVPGSPNNIADTSAIVVDTTAATITSATSTTGDGTYGPGTGINITLNFSENVTSGAGLTITLDTGAVVSTGALSNQSSYSGTYTVGATGSGQNTSDLTISGITGAMTDQGTNPNTTTNPTVPGGQNIADSKAIQVDTIAPTITLRQYQSSGSNGTVDRLLLTFDEAVVWNGNDLNQIAIVNNLLTNYDSDGTPNSLVSGSGTTTLLLSTSGTTNLTGITSGTEPSVQYTMSVTAGNRISDQYGNNLANFLATPIGDNAAPIIKAFSYIDDDSNGRIEKIIIYPSEGIVGASVVRANDFVFTNVGDFTGAAFGPDTIDYATSNHPYIVMPLGTEATPVDTRDDSGNLAISTQNSFSLVDATGNTNSTLGAQTLATILDEAKPVIISREYIDNALDGSVDRFEATFSEIVTWNQTDFNQFIIVNNSLTGFDDDGMPNGYVSGSGTNKFRLITSGTNDLTGVSGGTEPTLQYVQSATPANRVVDQSSNYLASEGSASAITDKAPPTLISTTPLAYYGASGTVNILSAGYTEEMNLIGYNDADWLITAGTIGLANETNAYVSLGDKTLIYLLADGTTFVTGGAVAPTLQYTNAANLSDGKGNFAATFGPLPIDDKAAPVVINGQYKDTDATADGQVDRIDLNMTADTGLACTYEAGDWSVPTAGTINVASVDACTVNGNTIELDVTADSGITGGAADPSIRYQNLGTLGSIKDGLNNETLSLSAGGQNITDDAAPVIMSTSPTNGETNVSISAYPQITFSEEIKPGVFGFTSTQTPSGGYTASWNGSNTVVSLAHGPYGNSVTYDLTITTAQANDTNSKSLVAGPVPNPFTFTTTSGGGGGGGGASGSFNIVEGSLSINNGASETVTSTVTLNLSSKDAKEMVIANDKNFTGKSWETYASTKTWELEPGYGERTVWVRYRNTYGMSNIYSATINVVESAQGPTIGTGSSILTADKDTALADGKDEVTVSALIKNTLGEVLADKTVILTSSRSQDTITPASAITDAAGKVTFKVTSDYPGVSTLVASVDGFSVTQTISVEFTDPETEELPKGVTDLKVGDLVKTKDSSAVYSFGKDAKRHSFPNETVYYSYYTDFSAVKTITAEQLAGLPLGSNVKLKPGTWLMKITSDPKVYAVSPGGKRHWVKTEEIAKALYGSTWNKKIVDMNVTLFMDYPEGTEISENKHPDAAVFQYKGGTTKYYISNGKKRMISDTVFTSNGFQSKFVQTDIAATVSYSDGTAITTTEDALKSLTY